MQWSLSSVSFFGSDHSLSKQTPRETTKDKDKKLLGNEDFLSLLL